MNADEQILLELTDREKARFWAKVQKGGPDDCWEWTRSATHGYGELRVRKHKFRSNRVVLTWKLGRTTQLDACHTCDNPPCCNPAHLFEGTKKQNMQDAVKKGRTKGIRVGSKNGYAKLDEELVRQAKLMLRAGIKQKVVAAKLNVRQCTISQINTGYTWSHVVV